MQRRFGERHCAAMRLNGFLLRTLPTTQYERLTQSPARCHCALAGLDPVQRALRVLRSRPHASRRRAGRAARVETVGIWDFWIPTRAMDYLRFLVVQTAQGSLEAQI